jgi:hypothetical protein
MTWVTATPSQARAIDLQIGVGLKGGINGSAVDRVPKEHTYELENGTRYPVANTELYPMFGIGGTFGLMTDVRFEDIIGLETGLHLSYDNGSGFEDKTVNGEDVARIYQEQRTTAFHIPLLLKVNVSGETVKPFLGLGVEFVIQTDSSLEYRQEERGGRYISPVFDKNEIEPSTYTLFQVTMGLEFDLGPVRIPIELRGGYNLGFDPGASSRVRPEGTNQANATFVYDGQYQGHFGVFTGVTYDFDLTL